MSESKDSDGLDEEDALLAEIARVDDLPAPSEPTRIAQFVVVERIGRGGMGIVYKVRDEQLDRIVALKLLQDGGVPGEGPRKRLLREARAAAALDHPNIAVVHGTGEADGHVFIAMEYVEGSTLRCLLERERLPLERVLVIPRQIAAALEHAHARGVTHRKSWSQAPAFHTCAAS